LQKESAFCRDVMKISDRRLKISDFSNSLGCCSTPNHPQQYAYVITDSLLAKLTLEFIIIIVSVHKKNNFIKT